MMSEKNGTLLITKLNTGVEEQIVSAFYEDGKLRELSCESPEQASLLGNIYVGKVKNIRTNIGAAFIEIADGLICYYSLRENENPVFVKTGKSAKLSEGDELLVQVSREAVKTKAPTVTCNLNFPGKYLVLTTGKKQLGLSNKLSNEEKQRLKELAAPYCSEDYGMIVRTNAAGVSEEELTEELSRLTEQVRHTLTYGRHLTCFSLVHREAPAYAAGIRGIRKEQLKEIVTDKKDLYQELLEYLKTYQPDDLSKLRLWQEDLSLAVVYSLQKELEEALRERVWLKSGAYLVIQPTEALTVVDVNTGKYEGRKKLRETFLRINKEAAVETARQLRLRNLSGIILVDFIDMEEQTDKNELMSYLAQELKKDPVKTVLVDMTPLGLVEITRKKVRKTLKEQIPHNFSNFVKETS